VANSLSRTTTVTMDEDKTVTANFRQVTPLTGKIAFASTRDGSEQVYVMNADGTNQTRLTSSLPGNYYPAWSPDGTRIVFTSELDSRQRIYVMNADGSNQTPLTTGNGDDHSPAWSPDGTKIAFVSTRDGGWLRIWVMNADGGDQRPLTTNPTADASPAWSPDGSDPVRLTNTSYDATIVAGDPAWSPDGTRIAFVTNRGGGWFSIWVMNADGSHQTRLTDYLADGMGDPAWSPDSTKIAFGSMHLSNWEICVMNADGSDRRTLTSNGLNPVWAQGSWIAPTVVTNDATNITTDSATLNGNLDSLGTATEVNVSFVWGTSPGSYIRETTPQPVSTTGAFSFDLSSLDPGILYYFQAKAVGDGTSYGDEKSFKTEEIVTFPDPNLEAAIRAAIDKPTGDIYRSDLEALTSLSATSQSIADLTGLEYCTNLLNLDLGGNLYISDISVLGDLTNLQTLDLHANQINGISALTGLTNLWNLGLGSNQISDISPLVANVGIGGGDEIYLQGNPLSTDSLNIYIPELQARGVAVYYSPNNSPAQPSNVSPTDGATGVSLTPALQSSDFLDFYTYGGDTHAASRWQITATPGDYSSPVFDSDTDTSNLTSITIPSGILDYATTYYWHVQYLDSGGAWSGWSAETSFTTEGEPVLPGDANGDGTIDALDITMVERIIARLDAPTAGADANQDGKINALDITKIERLIGGLG